MLESTEPDPRPQVGPTSGANHECSGRRTPRQGFTDQGGTGHSPALVHVRLGCAGATWSRDWGQKWRGYGWLRRQQPATATVMNCVAQGGGSCCVHGGSGL